MPTIEKLYQERSKKGLVLLGIGNEDPETFRGFYAKNRITFPTAVDQSGNVRAHYGGNVIPYSIVIDRKGKVVAQLAGPRPEEEFLEALKNAGLK